MPFASPKLTICAVGVSAASSRRDAIRGTRSMKGRNIGLILVWLTPGPNAAGMATTPVACRGGICAAETMRAIVTHFEHIDMFSVFHGRHFGQEWADHVGDIGLDS